MNIFISWSGERSHRIAKLLKTWIKGVIQAARPWISSTDISSGTIWFTEIIKQLDATTQGVICLTNENKEKPWILFEAGALANSGIESSRVYTLLVDIEQKDVQPPLAQFNLTKPDEEGMLKLMTDINNTLHDDVRLEKEVLERGFRVYWPEFKLEFDKAIRETHRSVPEQKINVRTDKEILSEILDTVRGLDKRVRNIEIIQPQLIGQSEDNFNIVKDSFESKQFSAASYVKDIAEAQLYISNALRIDMPEELIVSNAILRYPSVTRGGIIKIVNQEKAKRNAG